VICGCGNITSSGNGSSVNWANFWPHNIGNSWTYDKFITNETTVTTTVTTDTYTVTSQETIFSTIEVVVTEYISGLTDEVVYDRTKHDNTGVYSYSTSAGLTTEPAVILSYPLFVGKTWEVTATGWTAEVATVEQLVTPGGSFNAYKVITYASGSSFINWYADGYGRVKQYSKADIPLIGTIEATSILKTFNR
jgi:hypothetical protein